VIEVHEPTGELIAFLNQAYSPSYQVALNEPSQLNFKIPADDAKKVCLATPNEVWLRDYQSGEVIKKYRLNKVRDIRD